MKAIPKGAVVGGAQALTLEVQGALPQYFTPTQAGANGVQVTLGGSINVDPKQGVNGLQFTPSVGIQLGDGITVTQTVTYSNGKITGAGLTIKISK